MKINVRCFFFFSPNKNSDSDLNLREKSILENFQLLRQRSRKKELPGVSVGRDEVLLPELPLDL